jgi:hypothetical protein
MDFNKYLKLSTDSLRTDQHLVDEYLKLSNLLYLVKKDPEDRKILNNYIESICNDIKKISLLLDHKLCDDSSIEYLIEYVSIGGNITTLKYIIDITTEKYTEEYNNTLLSSVLYNACIYNHVDIIEYVLSIYRGPNYKCQFAGLLASCIAGNIYLVKKMLKLSSNIDSSSMNIVNLHNCFDAAILSMYDSNNRNKYSLMMNQYQYIDIIDEILKIDTTCTRGGLLLSSAYGDLELLKLMISKGSIMSQDINTAFYVAGYMGHLNVVKYIHHTYKYNVNIHECMQHVIDAANGAKANIENYKYNLEHDRCRGDNILVAKYLINEGATVGGYNVHRTNNVYLLKLYADLGINVIPVNKDTFSGLPGSYLYYIIYLDHSLKILSNCLNECIIEQVKSYL